MDNAMKNAGGVKMKKRRINRSLLFLLAVLMVYGILFLVIPEKTSEAVNKSGSVLFSMLLPLGLIFLLMVLVNLFLHPAGVVRFLGKSSGIKGIALSIAGGIISTGPIYAWYPLLKDLREKGAVDSLISIFLYNRAVKPLLLPVMVSYFGWIYVVVLTVLTIAASVVIGYVLNFVQYAGKKEPGLPGARGGV